MVLKQNNSVWTSIMNFDVNTKFPTFKMVWGSWPNLDSTTTSPCTEPSENQLELDGLTWWGVREKLGTLLDGAPPDSPVEEGPTTQQDQAMQCV